MKLWLLQAKKPLLFFIVFLVGLALFFPSFNLSLFGDDWMVFWRSDSFFPSSHTATLLGYLKHFLTRYGSQDILMGFFRSIYGYESQYYYLTSFITRIIAAFSLYPLVFYLTKNKFATLFAMLFFSVTTIGLETTEYIAHIPSYVGLTFFNFFLYFFLRSREKEQGRKIFLSGLFFYFTFIMIPYRMTGLMPFIVFVEAFWLMQNFNKKTVFSVIKRLSVILIIFLLIYISGNPFSYNSQGKDIRPSFNSFLLKQTTDSFFNILGQLKNGRSDLLFYPIISFGGMFIPDTALQSLSTAPSKSWLIFITLFVYSLFATIALVIIKSIFTTKSNSYRVILFLAALWSLISSIVFLLNQTTFPGSKFFILLLVGGYVAIFGLYLLYRFYNDHLVSQALFSSLSWSLASFLIPWLWTPTFLFDTYHRYLIGSAVGISLFLATIISLAKNTKYRNIVLFLFTILLIINMWTSSIQIQRLLSNHNQQVNDKIWAAMPYIPEVGKSEEPLVFYFEGDGTNNSILHDTVTFGFPYHMALIYGISEEIKNPISMIEWKDIESAVLDGKSFAPHYKGQVLDPVSPERVYAFQLQGQDKLINITDAARQKLNKLMQDQK